VVLPPAKAREFLRSLPAKTAPSGPPYTLVPMPGGLRLSSRPGAGSEVRLGGPERLRLLEPMLRFAESVRIHAPTSAGAAAVTVWQVDMPDARLMLTLSPAASRGFSGEGGVLAMLADPAVSDDAEVVACRLGGEVDVAAVAADTGLSEDRVVSALAHLGASGIVGYDVAEGRYFHRELPFAATEKMHPRITGAQKLVQRSTVTLVAGGGRVVSGRSSYDVRDDGDRTTCTCPWFARHRQERGPCKHVLAVRMARQGDL
jgi:hypothetical protein